MKRKSKSSKSKEVSISAAEITRFGMGVMSKALNVVNTAKKSKLTIRLDQE